MGHRAQPVLLQPSLFLVTLLVSSLPQFSAANLLLGQILTGTGYNKAIEIRNTGQFSEAANLTQYGLLWLPNGQDVNASGWAQLKAPIAEEPVFVQGGDSYVIAPSRAPPSLVGNANAFAENFFFDGNDVLALAIRAGNNTWTPVDIVGDPEHYNEYGYRVAGVSNATRNHTLLRKDSVTTPTTNWTLSAGTNAANSQWVVLPSSAFEIGGKNDTASAPPRSATCTNATRRTGDRRSNKTELKIATWTVDWLFDGVDDPLDSPWNGGASCPGNPSDPAFVPINQCNAAGAQARIKRVASRIKALDVDILNVVEVEGCRVLQQLVNGSNASYASYLGVSNDTATQRNLGLLSKVDPAAPLERIPGVKSYPLPGSTCGFNGTGVTDATANFRTTFQVSNLSVSFIGLLLPGYPLDPEDCAVREAQAAIIEEEVRRQIEAGQEVIVAGNFNDWSAADTDPLGHVPISRVLQMLQRPNGSDLIQLYSAATWLSGAERYMSEGPAMAGGSPALQQVDYVLITAGLASLDVTVKIVDNNTLNTLSSHWPLVVTLRLPSKNTTSAPSGASLPVNSSWQTTASVNSSSNSSSSVLVPSSIVTSTTISRSSKKSSSTVLPTVLGIVGAVVVLVVVSLLAMFVIMRRRRRVYNHKRLQRPSQVEVVEQSSQSMVEQTRESESGFADDVKDVETPPAEWRPIDRSMPTIKSGELLEVGLFGKSPFDDDD